MIILLLVLSMSIDGLAASQPQHGKKRHKRRKPATIAPLKIGPEISEIEAVRIAEQFIIDNGYTDLPPAADRKKFTYELLDKLFGYEKVIALRHNSLERKAYGIAKSKPDNLPGWTVIFRRTPNDKFDPDYGRGVVMELDGSRVKMEYNEWLLSNIDKKLTNDTETK